MAQESTHHPRRSKSFSGEPPQELPSALSVPQEAALGHLNPVNVEEEEWTYPDGGMQAWLSLLGCFIMATSSMAWGLIWGVFQEHFHSVVFPDVPQSVISLVGGVLASTGQATSFLSGNLGDRYGYKRVLAMSCFLTFLCYLASSFSTRLWQVFLFQGFLTGFAQGTGIPLYMSIPSQWFLKKRGLATGIAISGSGFGGAIGSLIARKMIVTVGYQKTLLIYSFINGFWFIVAWLLIAERPPPRILSTSGNPQKRGWFPKKTNYAYYSLILSTFIGIFGYLSPLYLISTYTKYRVPDMDPNSLLVAVPLVVLNLSAGVGRIGVGFLADKIGVLNAFFLSFLLGGLFQMLVWTFATTFGSIMAFSVLYGLVGGCFLSLIPVCCATILGTNSLATSVGVVVLANAPGQLAGAPIGSAILAATGKWYSVSLYSGGVMLLGAFCVLPARFWKDKRLFAKV